MGFLEILLAGIVQGVTEWLPLSSEGMVSIVLTQALPLSLQEAVVIALWLHLGTLLAAVIYFRKDIHVLVRKRDETFRFLVFATVFSLLVGAPLLIFVLEQLVFSGQAVMVVIGLLLLVTAGLQFSSGRGTRKRASFRDALISGVAQGFAVLPGLSRSGLTVSMLLLRKHNPKSALRLSFLMSIPVVLLAGVWALSRSTFQWDLALPALGASVTFGLLTIRAMFRLAEKVNFAVFTLIIGLLAIASGLL